MSGIVIVGFAETRTTTLASKYINKLINTFDLMEKQFKKEIA